jgi:phospholipid/cholesterol/gamma-HCH transport system substrate-binding protein
VSRVKRLPNREALAESGPPLARIAAAAALTLVTLALLLLVANSSGTYKVVAVFDDVRGLIPGGQVEAGGIAVGQVDSIALGDDGLPRVTMTISKDFQLRQGAFADIRLASNVGGLNRYVDLTQGKGPELSDGATLGPSHTEQPVDLDLALSDLDPKTRRDIGAILAGVDRATRRRGEDLAKALRHSGYALGETADLLAQVNSDKLALRNVVASSRAVVGALAKDPAALGQSADRVASLLRVTARRQADLARATQLLGPGLTSARTALEHADRAIPDLEALVDASRPAVAQLVPTARVLRPALGALGPLLDQAKALIADAPDEIAALRPALNAADRSFPYLRPILSGFGPVLDAFRARTPEMVNFFTLGDDVTSDYDANGNVVRASTILIQTARHTNEVGPSSDQPGLEKRPFDRNPGSLEGDPWKHYWRSFIGGGRAPRSYLQSSGANP